MYPRGEVTARGASPGAWGIRGDRTVRGLRAPGGEGTKAAGARASKAKPLFWVCASVCYNLISPSFCSISPLPFASSLGKSLPVHFLPSCCCFSLSFQTQSDGGTRSLLLSGTFGVELGKVNSAPQLSWRENWGLTATLSPEGQHWVLWQFPPYSGNLLGDCELWEQLCWGQISTCGQQGSGAVTP